MSHVEYFDLKGYFQCEEYFSSTNVGTELDKIGDIDLTEAERQNLERVRKLAERDSKKGKLAGIVNLIETVENLMEKYGVRDDCSHYKQSTAEFLDEISGNKAIVKRYGLENYLNSKKRKRKVISVKKNKKEACR